MRKMEVYGTVHQTVYVEPLDVVKQLFRTAVSHDYYDVLLGKDADGYFYEYEEYKFSNRKKYIEESEYEYLKSLQTVIERLEKERV